MEPKVLRTIVQKATQKEENVRFMLDEAYRKQLIRSALENDDVYSKHDLARKLGYHGKQAHVNIWRIKKGKRTIPLEKLIFLCDYAGTSLEDVYEHVEFLKIGRKIIQPTEKKEEQELSFSGKVTTQKISRTTHTLKIEAENIDLDQIGELIDTEAKVAITIEA